MSQSPVTPLPVWPPLWLRLWHGTNAVLFLVLIVTGTSLHFADPTLPLVPFKLAYRLHTLAGVALALLYGVFLVANIVTGHWWQYVPKPERFFFRCWQQMRFLGRGIFEGEPPPFSPSPAQSFNALEQIIYGLVMYLVVPTSVLTGLVFLWPEFAPRMMFGVDGLLPVAVLHTVAGLVLTLFMIAHIYLGSTGATVAGLYRMMIKGMA